jgi:hypothetical protein
MAEDLCVEEGEDDNLWITSSRFGTAVAVCKEVGGEWFAAEDDSFMTRSGGSHHLMTWLITSSKTNYLVLGGAPACRPVGVGKCPSINVREREAISAEAMGWAIRTKI